MTQTTDHALALPAGALLRMKVHRRRPFTPAALIALLIVLTACGGAVESFPLFYVGAKSVTKPHASSEHHPYANHRDPRVRAASRELQRVRDLCEWVETGDPMRVCAAPDDDDETAALAALTAALVAARGVR